MIDQKLLSLGFHKQSPKSLANYNPALFINNFIYISGQLPLVNNKIIHKGKIGLTIKKKEAIKSIEIATSNLLWNLYFVLNKNKLDLNKLKTLNIKGYLNTIDDFDDHSLLFNVASDLIIKILGKKKGMHTRAVIGVSSLPLNSPVEIEGIFFVK